MNSNEPIEVQTDVVWEQNLGEEFKKEEICTIRIRTENGNWNLILKMKISDWVSKIYEFVEPYREETGVFEIWSTFPRMTLLKSES